MSRQAGTYQSKKTGMTLLEVILSIALLGGAMVIVGEKARSAFQDARLARDLVQAELLAESILAKVRLGIIEMIPEVDVPVGSGHTNQADIIQDTHAVSAGNTVDVRWLYSLEVNPVDDYGYLVEIAVTVRQNVAEVRQPVVCRLVRWLAIEPEEEEEE